MLDVMSQTPSSEVGIEVGIEVAQIISLQSCLVVVGQADAAHCPSLRVVGI